LVLYTTGIILANMKKRRNPVAAVLRLFHKQIVRSRKKYSRKIKHKEKI
tara:strand:+ start:640 stop:786 length:147 start_codon:yes stop_codon:yes gene_type:complete